MADFRTFNTVDETAAILRTNRKTVYDAIARGEIPVVRVGRAIRVPGKWLESVSGKRDAVLGAPQPEAALAGKGHAKLSR